MNILQINANARREAANSTRVANSIVARLQSANLIVRDLAVTPHPALEEAAIGFLGIIDVDFIYAEGLNMGAEAAERCFAQAEADLASALA